MRLLSAAITIPPLVSTPKAMRLPVCIDIQKTTAKASTAETRQHLFEPITPPSRKGEGLGLSIVSGIWTTMAARSDVSSRPGKTSIQAKLPER